MKFDYGLLDSFYLSEDSITDKKFYPSGIYTIVDVIIFPEAKCQMYIMVNNKYLASPLVSIRVPISERSLEILFKTSLIEEYEYYETN